MSLIQAQAVLHMPRKTWADLQARDAALRAKQESARLLSDLGRAKALQRLDMQARLHVVVLPDDENRMWVASRWDMAAYLAGKRHERMGRIELPGH